MPLRAELTELADWVEGLSTAAHIARDEGNITLAEALEKTRFEVYQAYLDELHEQHSQGADTSEARRSSRVAAYVTRGVRLDELLRQGRW